MKNIKLLVLILLLGLNPAWAFKYSENDKNMFYDAFIEGYFTEMEKTVNKLDIPQENKDKFLTKLKARTDKRALINSSWSCIEKYPVEQIVAASVICTSDWTNSQLEKNKDLYELLK